MLALRKLSLMYVLCALAFSVQLAFDRDPALALASRQTVAAGLQVARDDIAVPAGGLLRDANDFVVASVAGAVRVALAGQPAAVKTAGTSPRLAIPAAPPVVPAKPVLLAPNFPAATPPHIQIAQMPPPPLPAQPAKPVLALVPPPAPPSAAQAAVAPAELVRVTLRLKENLTHEMLDNFSLFLYVSKADNGPWAQHMYVFRKDASGNLAMLYNWAASTGREKIEMAPNGTRQPSYTPQGYYQLDPDRMFKSHYSGQWHQPMPFAMFFNWEQDGLQTGLAIHGASGIEVTQLGSRASAGCIRIAPENAALLFNLIRAQYRGLAPRFAYDRRTASMSNAGVMMHDASGNLAMADGYKVLVFVENYGGENVVAALF